MDNCSNYDDVIDLYAIWNCNIYYQLPPDWTTSDDVYVYLYDSNGNYTIQFNNGYEKKAIVFNIENKGDIKSYEEIKKKEHRFITL